MFNLSALVTLTLFNLLALAHLASGTLLPARLETRLAQSIAAFCLAVSLTALLIALAIPAPGLGVATVSIAGFVNLLAVLGPTTRRLSNLSAAGVGNQMSGLARLYFTGQTSPKPPRRAATPTTSRTRSRPIIQPVRSVRPISRPLAELGNIHPMSLAALPGTPARPASTPAISRAAPEPALRRTYTVPHRPNRIVGDSGAFLLTPEPATAPNIFDRSPAATGKFVALANRVRLVTTDKHNAAVLPLTFAAPDPAWQTTYGRLVALGSSA